MTVTQDQVACMIVCPLQRVVCTLGMVSRVVMFWPLPSLKPTSGVQTGALHLKFAHELVQGIALGSSSKLPGSVDADSESDAAQGSFVACRSMCYVSSREGDAWIVMGHEGIVHLLNVKKREHRSVLITAPEIASLVTTSGAFDENDPNLILCVGCESGCILLYDPRSARQDSKPFRRLELFSQVAHSIKAANSSTFFITEGEIPVSHSQAAASPGASSQGWGASAVRREVGVAVTHMCRWPNVGVFVALARGCIQVYDQQRWTLQRTLEFHTDVLVGMCIDVLHKVIITASRDRRLLLWDPFIDKPISEVNMHSAPYVSMLFLQSQQLLVTVGADKIIDIWHVQTMSRVMRFTDDLRHKGIDRLSSAVWDPIHKMFFTAGNAIRRFTVNALEQVLRKHKAKTDAVNSMDNASMLEVAESAGLSQPIIAVLFTSTLGQLIVVSDVECRVIEAQSGSTITTFSLKAYGRCSCACLDVCGRRLMTGSETGTVCMWEYSLGRLLKVVNRMPPVLQFESVPMVKERVEVSCICCVAQANLTVRPLVVGDWNHNLVMCSDSADAIIDTSPAVLQGHRHDVLCVVSCGNFLVSGDANGLAIVWFILNGHRRHSIQVTKLEGSVGLSGTSINCGVWIGSARQCYLGTSEGEIVGINPVLGQIKSRTSLVETPSVSCITQGSICSSDRGRQFQMVSGTTDGNLFFFSVPVMDQNALALKNLGKTSTNLRLKSSVLSNADVLLNTKGSKLQMSSDDYVPTLNMHTHVLAHQNAVSAVVIAEISGITVTGSVDGGLRLWSWSGQPLSVIGTSIPWPYWEISNQSNQELISQEMERLERQREEEKIYETQAKLKEIQDAKDSAARLHKQWCVNLAKTSSGAGLLPLSESVDVFKFLDESDSSFKSTNAKEAEGKTKSGSLLVPSSLSYRPIDGIDHICASLLKQNRQKVEETIRMNEEESRLGRIFIQLETALTQSEDPRDAGYSVPFFLFV
jgi:WD40 repeat protein